MAYKKMSEEESLRRSHSGASNFRLTLICLLFALSLTVLVASVATLGTTVLAEEIVAWALAASGVMTVVSLFLIACFRR